MKRNLGAALVLMTACAQAPVITTASPATELATTTLSTTTPATGASATSTTAAVDRVAASVDLDGFLAELEMTHPEPFHGVSRADFVSAMEDLKAGIATIAPAGALVETMRLTALLSSQGRDGHQFAIPHTNAEGPILPFRIYEFDDGVFITADHGERGLVGARLVGIGGHSIGEVLAAVEPLVPRDGPATVPSFRPFFTLRTQVLEGLGLIAQGAVEIDIEREGETESLIVDPISHAEFQAWGGQGGFTFLPDSETLIYRRSTETNFWMEDLEEDVLYVRYSAVAMVGAGQTTELLERAAVAERIVFDLRHNPGGNNRTYNLLLGALQNEAVNQPGRLFLLTDRVTFSAASNLATEIEQTTDAVFVGEAMGGGLNFWNDVKFHPMPHLPVPMRIGVSTIYHQKSIPDDPRLTIDPDIDVPVLSSDYFSGRDAVLEAVLAAG
jgi:hypothetical protein